MGIFKKSTGFTGDNSAPTPSASAVTAQLNHKLMPIARGDRYENPLHDELARHGFGETDGGGTMMSKTNEIEFIDVELVLNQIEKSIPFVIDRLESYGAPKGSKLIVRDGDKRTEIPFGKAEGIGVYLDGINLPDEVYKTSDINVVIAELNKVIQGHGSYQNYWQGPVETALYFYGPDAELMKKLIDPVLAIYPLCRGARIVTIAPKASA